MKFLVVFAAALSVAYCRDAITVDPGTSTGTGGVDVAGAGLQNLYCETKGKECQGADLESARFSAHIDDCLSRCNLNLKCLTVFYSNDKQCHLRGKRCAPGQLKSASGSDYYRLNRGDSCPAGRPLYKFNGPFYGNTFCMLFGKACKGRNIYPKPQNIGPTYEECLKKCAKLKNCAMVDFYMEGGRPKCEPKEQMCSDDDLVDAPGTQNFLRLLQTETKCPSNRGPPSPTAPPATKPPPPPPCPANSSRKGGKCVCHSGYEMVGNKCLAKCPSNSRRSGGRCVCNSRYEMVGNQCLRKCPAYSRRSGGQCVCNSGYEMVASVCIAQCPENGYRAGLYNCACKTGYVMQGNKCVQPSCQENAFFNGARCVCRSGFVEKSGQCIDNRPCNQREVSQELIRSRGTPRQINLRGGVLFYVQACGVKYQFRSRGEAAQYCRKYHGARLATPAQIQEAYNQGQYHCGCGWVTAGDARFPVVGHTRRGCGNPNQVSKCQSRFMGKWGGPGWDAWCFMPGAKQPGNCPTNAMYDGSKCVCAPKFNMQGNRCVKGF